MSPIRINAMPALQRPCLWLFLPLLAGSLAGCAGTSTDPARAAAEALERDRLAALENSDWLRRQAPRGVLGQTAGPSAGQTAGQTDARMDGQTGQAVADHSVAGPFASTPATVPGNPAAAGSVAASHGERPLDAGIVRSSADAVAATDAAPADTATTAALPPGSDEPGSAAFPESAASASEARGPAAQAAATASGDREDVESPMGTAPQAAATGGLSAGAAAGVVKLDWLLETVADPVTGDTRCAVTSTPRDVMNGTLETVARLLITEEAVFLRTDATLDITPPESGFRIDAGIPIRFDAQLNDVTAVVDAGREPLVERLQDGSFLSVHFAYEPHFGDADTYRIDYSLDGFSDQLDALSSCERPAAS